MKTMTCRQLWGACGKVFQAETFEEIAQMSQEHGKEMLESGDEPHMEAMNKMSGLMQDPTAMDEQMTNKQKEFEVLPEDEE